MPHYARKRDAAYDVVATLADIAHFLILPPRRDKQPLRSIFLVVVAMAMEPPNKEGGL